MSETDRSKNRPAHQMTPGVEPPARAVAGSTGKRPQWTAEEYVQGVRSGDRASLARAITLIESNSRAHFEQAQEVVKMLLPKSGGAIRVGITGMPGAGKSSFIETLGMHLVQQGHRVAVTTVDPTSSVTGGSILGDKTRMEKLAAHPHAFIRPSPSGGALGGVARKTRETILLFEAAGYGVVLVETIGVGQSEIAVRSLVDFFLLLLIPGAGDELQGLKRGVVELADAILVNKADGETLAAANRARVTYENTLRFLTPATEGWTPRAYTVSALSGEGIDQIWELVREFVDLTQESGVFYRRRREQARSWVHEMIRDALVSSFARHPEVMKKLPALEQQVMDGKLPATTAAVQLLRTFGVDALGG